MRKVMIVISGLMLAGCAATAVHSSDPVKKACGRIALQNNSDLNTVGIFVAPVGVWATAQTEAEYQKCLKNPPPVPPDVDWTTGKLRSKE